MKLDATALSADFVTNVDEFKQWTRAAIRSAFPHQVLLSGFGRVYAGGVIPDFVVGVDLPESYLEGLRNRTGAVDTPVMRRFLETREPQLFEADHPWPGVPAGWLACFREHELRNVAAHGVYDTMRCVVTYHSFYRIPGRLGRVHAGALKQIVPIMHEVICKVVGPLLDEGMPGSALPSLSSREQDVARWVRLGKSNGVIAKILKLSENTVKHHLTSIFRKLAVDCRAELIHRLSEEDARRSIRFGKKLM